MDAPCKTCEDRRTGCHGSCDAYRVYTSMLDEQKSIRDACTDICMYNVETMKKLKTGKYYRRRKDRK